MLAMTGAALAGSREPAQVAVEFLDKVRTGKLNIEPGGDTDLTANTDEPKRREIARRLERNAADLDHGTLEASSTKIDANLAAVLVRKVGGFDPNRLRVFAVALIKHGDAWRPAPVLASFENSGVGYAPGLRQRLAALEAWMLEQQAVELAAIQQQAGERMRQAISVALPPEELRQLAPTTVARRFLDACAKQQLPVMLGLLGGLQPEPPEDWNKRLQAAEAAAAEPQTAKRPWRLLVAPEVLRCVVRENTEASSASLAIACLDPIAAPGHPAQLPLELVELNLEKTADGLWQVNLPPWFVSAKPQIPAADDPDTPWLSNYPATLRHTIPLQALPTPQAALSAYEQALHAPTLEPLMAMLDLDGDKTTARLGCLRAASAWGALHDPACIRHPLALGFFATDSVAAASFQYFSLREPDRLDVHVCFFEKAAAGWHLLAGFLPKAPAAANLLAAKTWADGEASRRADTWRTSGLSGSTQVSALAPGNAPPEAAARSLVESWLAAIRAGNVAEALALTAWLDPDTSPARVLRNLSYEISGAGKATSAAAILTVTRGHTWTTVAVCSHTSDPHSHPIYPVISSPAGPKILIEVDWFAHASRSREFLNTTAVSHLRNQISPTLADELHDLFTQQAAAIGH